MKLNGGPKQYMPLPQSQSDEDENSFLKLSKLQSLETEKNGIANGCAKNADNKEIKNHEEKQSMSTLRKIFFVFSIFLCVFFIILFIWIIPCQLPISPISSVTKDWSLVLNNIDSVTTLLLASHSLLPHPFIIMGFKDQQDNVTGLTAINSITGQQIWTTYLHDVPIYASFDKMDVNNDNIPDCLILGNQGLLFVINIMDGHKIWYFHDHTRITNLPVLLPPVLFPSCENRTSYDLIGIISDENLKLYLVRINISTGGQKGDPLAITVCDGKITELNKWNDSEISVVFHCRDENRHVNIWSLSQSAICNSNQSDVNWKRLYSLKNANKVIVKPVEKNIIIAWDDGNMILLNGSNIKWKSSFNFMELSVIFDGYFMSTKLETALVIKDYNGTNMVSIINIENGNITWSKIISDTIISVKKISNILPKSDGILLKLISPSVPLHEKFANNSLLKNLPNTTVDIQSNINILNESYVLLMCWKRFSFTPLFQKTLLTKCENQCWPDMHLSSNTGIASPNKDGSVRTLTVSSTLIPNNTSFISQTTLTSATFQFQQCSIR